MGPDDHNPRRAAIESVLAFAAKHPGHGLGLHLPEVRSCFRSRRELMLALQQDWSKALRARIDLLTSDPKRCHLDAAKRARVAWAETAQTNSVLRRLLDTYWQEIEPTTRRAEDLFISTGLGLHLGLAVSTRYALA